MSTGCQSQQSHGSEQGVCSQVPQPTCFSSHGSEQGVGDFLAMPVIGIGFADNTENTENTDNQCENII